MYRSHPDATTLSRSPTMAEAVTAIKGTPSSADAALTRRATPYPSSLGRAISHKIRSGLVRSAASTPSSLSHAAIVVCPKAFKRYVMSSRLAGLSSTTRMQAPMSGPRQRQSKRAALAEFAGDADRAPQELGQLLAQVEPESGSVGTARRCEWREGLE